MKTIATTVPGIAGLIYGLLAVNLVYQDSPETLRWFIVAGVTSVGASAGWIAGFAAGLFWRPPTRPTMDPDHNRSITNITNSIHEP